VLADSRFKLVDGKNYFTQVFYLGNSNESIFELQFDQRVQQNNAVYSLYGEANDPNGEICFPMTLAYDAIEKVRGEHSPFNKKITASVTESVDDCVVRNLSVHMVAHSTCSSTPAFVGYTTSEYQITIPVNNAQMDCLPFADVMLWRLRLRSNWEA
jgi:hypothetical protein